MSDQQKKFEQAAKDVKSLPKKPDNNALLKIYSLYKQATSGDVSGSRPGFTDLAGRAKYDAWQKISGKSKKDAMKEYIDFVEKLKA